MNDLSNQQKSVELLQQLGLQEYEAKAFVALTRLPNATAKQISDVSEVPRTRVYDAVRVLETKGLVEIQHSNPQQFRAVSIDEATETLRDEYDSRIESLREALGGIEPIETDTNSEVTHEVWALSGASSIQSRTEQLIDDAEREVVIVIGHSSVFTDRLRDGLVAAHGRGVDVIVGTVSEELRKHVQAELPDSEVFVSGLEWLTGAMTADDETEISRLLLVDQTTILVGTAHHDSADGQRDERAVFGRGFDNGLVAITRRLMATGLLPTRDPERDES